MICIMDYGVGNVQSFLNLYHRLGIDACRATTPDTLSLASHIVLPGVGHFDRAMQYLNNSGMRTKLEELVLVDKIPVIGICVGMQMLSEGSDEGTLPGLNWIPGRVRAFTQTTSPFTLPLPHMGWNTLNIKTPNQLFSDGLDDSPEFYFLHSYFFDATSTKHVSATANYGIEFHAALSRGHIHGVQFHPEKSHHWGTQLLKNFANC